MISIHFGKVKDLPLDYVAHGYTLAWPRSTSLYTPDTSPATHRRCTSSRRKPCDFLKLALYIRIYLGKEKDANGCGLDLKDRSIREQSPRPARGFHVVTKPRAKKALFSDPG